MSKQIEIILQIFLLKISSKQAITYFPVFIVETFQHCGAGVRVRVNNLLEAGVRVRVGVGWSWIRSQLGIGVV